MRLTSTFSLAVLFFLGVHAQNFDYYEDFTGAQLADRVYRNTIKTVSLRPMHDPNAAPIVKLNSSEKLVLHFDDLGSEYRYYNYTLIHCNADWTPSDLLKSQYIDGFQEYLLENFDYSINCFVPYTHYQITIPNNNVSYILSGNYVLLVYENDQSEPILTRRFVVYEDLVNVQATVNRATYLDYRFTHQEVDFNINFPGYNIPDPYNDLHVSIIQNNNWNKGIFDLKPQFVSNGQLSYNYDYENAFRGGNEFRSFDTKDMNQRTISIQKTELDSNWTAFLVPDLIRSIQKYAFMNDINGRYVVRKLDRESDIEADYVWVDFYLQSETPIAEGDVHVNGAFCDWQATSDNKLKYDHEKKAYRGRVLIKQGYVDYQYVVKRPDGELDESVIEGSYWETNNEYTIIVYHREIGLRYDRVIAFRQLNYAL